MVFDYLNMGIFNTVQYAPALKDDGWLSNLEAAADVCCAPSRWVAAEIWEGGKTYTVKNVRQEYRFGETDILDVQEDVSPVTTGVQKVMRIVLGLILSIPGQILAIPLMATAYCCSEEIRLKHTITVRKLSDEELQKLGELITKRQELAKERQGCEPISCLLGSICSLLCYIICCKDD